MSNVHDLKKREAQIAATEETLNKDRTELQEVKRQLIAQRQQIAIESQRINAEKQRLAENQNRKMAQATKSYLGTVEPYQDSDEWTSWVERLELYFDANDIEDAKKRVSILLTNVGAKWYTLIKNLSAPTPPKEKTSAEIVNLVNNHVQPAPSVIAERYKFKKCVQEENENINQFCAKLKAAARYCEFAGELNDHLRNQFVWGVANETIKKKLLSEKQLTYEKAVQIADATEIVIKDAAGMSSRGSSINVVREARDLRRKNFPAGNSALGNSDKGKSKTNNNSNNNNKNCFRCSGLNHSPANCRFIEYMCNICSKKGHIARACRSKNKVNHNKKNNNLNDQIKNGEKNSNRDENKQHFVDECNNLYFNNRESREDFFVVEESKFSEKFYLTVSIDKKAVKMEIDTESAIAAIPRNFYEKNFNSYPLTKTSRTFVDYIGNIMSPVGFFKVNVVYNEISGDFNLFVFDGKSNPIIGREWLRPLKIINESNHEPSPI